LFLTLCSTANAENSAYSEAKKNSKAMQERIWGNGEVYCVQLSKLDGQQGPSCFQYSDGSKDVKCKDGYWRRDCSRSMSEVVKRVSSGVSLQTCEVSEEFAVCGDHTYRRETKGVIQQTNGAVRKKNFDPSDYLPRGSKGGSGSTRTGE